jgi:hypothetical protein
MGILDNLENAWDGLEEPNLAVKIFSETCCSGCTCQRESMPIPETDAMGREIFWLDIGRKSEGDQ